MVVLLQAYYLLKRKRLQGLSENTLLCSVSVSVQCPVLALHSLVKSSQWGCLTSQMKFNTTCSFAYPQGYQLQGPSNKFCQINGQWTDSAKSVSCNGGFTVFSEIPQRNRMEVLTY